MVKALLDDFYDKLWVVVQRVKRNHIENFCSDLVSFLLDDVWNGIEKGRTLSLRVASLSHKPQSRFYSLLRAKEAENLLNKV